MNIAVRWSTLLSSSSQRPEVSETPDDQARIVNQASKITQTPQTSLSELYKRSVMRKATVIIEDASHPLHHHFSLLPSGRRYRVPLARRNIYKKSFIPTAITALNGTK
ncbi:hypothetical protein WMY93_012508 [Mugilogobius chulae]|uniref:Uncharacterized protein n=1 Tax=Mugilogobius chulae TaxID=88201 RepID=A0AAW0PEM6_9GOBI